MTRDGLDPLNRYAVAVRGDSVTLLAPPLRGEVLSRERALMLAAWLAELAETLEGPATPTLDQCRAAVRAT